MTNRDMLRIYRCRSCKVAISTSDRLDDGTCLQCSQPFDGVPPEPPRSARAGIESLIIDGLRGRFESCPLCSRRGIRRTPTIDTCNQCATTFNLRDDQRWHLELSELMLAEYERQGLDPPGTARAIDVDS